MTFGDRLKELRKQHNLGQKEVGAWIGVSDSSIRKYEAGERTPTPDALVILAEHFGVTVDYLLGRATEPAKRAASLSEDAVNDIFDDEDLRALARDRLEGATPAEIANNKKRLKRMIEVMFDAEDND